MSYFTKADNTPDPSDDIASRVPHYLGRLSRTLNARLPAPGQDPDRLGSAMRYACEGGKRLRALLVYAAGEALKVPAAALDAPALSVELIHTFSLVHDDLPAMDNDDLRRGRPTVHKAFDEATAILVGDSLHTLAFEVLTDDNEHSTAAQRLRMVRVLTQAAGIMGMCGGQAIDMESEGKQIPLERLELLHSRKTASLIMASLQLAACAADASPAQVRALNDYGRAIGLAFQIQDDVLDVTACETKLGKTKGKDLAQQKSTFPALLGLEEATQRAAAEFAKARAALKELPEGAPALAWLADFIEGRQH